MSAGSSASLVEADGAVAALRPDWDRLAAELGRPSALSAWVLAFEVKSAERRILALRGAGGELEGLMPLRTRRHAWGTDLELLGSELAEGFAILARRGSEQRLAEAARHRLQSREPRLAAIRLASHPADDAWASRMGRARAGGHAVVVERKVAPYVALDEPDFARWMATRPKSTRRSATKARRRLERAGGTVAMVTAAHELPSALDDFMRLHRARWQDRGGSGVLVPHVERAIRAAGPELLASGNLRLWGVAKDGRSVGCLLCLRAGPTMLTWLGGFDEHGGRLQSPLLLRLAAIEDAYALGCTTVELGTGGGEFKARLATGSREVQSSVLHLPGPRGAAAGLVTAGRVARVRAGSRLPPEWKARLRRFRER